MKQAIEKVFLDHPRSVDETFGQHFGVAMGFGLRLLGAGLAAVVHALVPCLFKTTASATVKQLHSEMVTRTPKAAPQQAT